LKNSKLESDVRPDATATPLRSIPVDSHRIDSRDLFVGTRELTIAHGSETYRLRLTAQNKLILTK
jgi:hemin uptake protein HemP